MRAASAVFASWLVGVPVVVSAQDIGNLSQQLAGVLPRQLQSVVPSQGCLDSCPGLETKMKQAHNCKVCMEACMEELRELQAQNCENCTDPNIQLVACMEASDKCKDSKCKYTKVAALDENCKDSNIQLVACMEASFKCKDFVDDFTPPGPGSFSSQLTCMCKTCPIRPMFEFFASARKDAQSMVKMTCEKIRPVVTCVEAENKKKAGTCLVDGVGLGVFHHLPCLCSTCPPGDVMAEMATMTETDASTKQQCKMLGIYNCMEEANRERLRHCPPAAERGSTRGPAQGFWSYSPKAARTMTNLGRAELRTKTKAETQLPAECLAAGIDVNATKPDFKTTDKLEIDDAKWLQRQQAAASTRAGLTLSLEVEVSLSARTFTWPSLVVALVAIAFRAQ